MFFNFQHLHPAPPNLSIIEQNLFAKQFGDEYILNLIEKAAK